MFWRKSIAEGTVSKFFLLLVYGAGVEPSPLLLWSFIGLLYQPLMIDGDDFGVNSGKNECQGNPKCSEKTVPVPPLCPPQIPHDLIRDRTWAAAEESRRLSP
jgi:hypothetical protein